MADIGGLWNDYDSEIPIEIISAVRPKRRISCLKTITMKNSKI